MTQAVIFDCEFLVSAGAHTRFWCGPDDPDPIVAQIGAVRLDLTGDFTLTDTYAALIVPRDRTGAAVSLDPVFSNLTGISQDQMDADGIPLGTALDQFENFAGDSPIWSWGKDEFNLVAISCFVAGIPPPLPADRFGNATALLRRAGMPMEQIHRTRSHTLMAAFGLPPPDGASHDALTDAKHVALTLQHLLETGRLTAEDFALPKRLH